ncbi:MAG TPA: DNA repair exonuclease [Candidatus Limnocylindrales bacterium]|nr:DNA repair exonuclease [Candidatus Limnocylindrales bacterium]
MLRLLHTADVHLGARHTDLGDRAAALRERQFAAFRASIDLALAERVDLFLIAGDLFDSNVQPRRTVDRAAAELRRLVEARIRTVIVPGTHDVFDRSSIYRAYDLPAMAGAVGSDFLTVLSPDRPDVVLAALDTVVHGPCFATKRAPHSPLRDLDAAKDDRATWRIGLLHAAIAIPNQTEHDEVVVTTEEIAATHLDYLALGHWHSTSQGKAGSTPWAYSGAPEAVAIDQDRAGSVLLVTLEEKAGKKRVAIESRSVAKTRFERFDVDAASVVSQPALAEQLAARADPDLALDVRLIGVRPETLDLDAAEVEADLADRFLRLRVRDRSVAPLTEGVLPPVDTVLGAFIHDLEGRIAELEAASEVAATNGTGTDHEPAAGEVAGAASETPASDVASAEGPAAAAGELRDALRLGRLLLAGEEVTL